MLQSIYITAIQEHKNLWRDRRRYSLRNQKSSRADRSCCCGYPDNKPDFYGNLQNIDLFEDKKCDHHQPHPAAKECTIAAAKVVLEAAVKAGAPEGIIGWIDAPSLELTNTVMRDADIILATGGPGMVKAAYSSGKPALGVGAGNTPVIIDDTADVRMAVNSIIHSKTFDNGMICASEQSVTFWRAYTSRRKKSSLTEAATS